MLRYLILLTATAALISPVHSQETTDRVHAFYYSWYGNPQTDGSWQHWNHVIIDKPGVTGKHYTPPDDIGANFYPAIGLYSSNSAEAVDEHCRMMKRAGIGVISVTWWGRNTYTDKTVPVILAAAERNGLKVNFHIEPYGGRNALSVKDDLKYIIDTYGRSDALYRSEKHGNRPMFYLYDSYLTEAEEWAVILNPNSKQTIRGTTYDCVMIGLYVKEHDHEFMLKGHFDGFYTYFATERFTYGSTPSNWKTMAAFAEENHLLFIPSVGPGYDDTRIRPWNGKNQRDRNNGSYYDAMFQAAINSKPEIISITSFNEWHEGTQIEPSIPKKIDGYTYLDFQPLPPDGYLELTKDWIEKFLQN